MSDQPKTNLSSPNRSTGLTLAISGYLWWAVVTPLYFDVLREVPALELLAWRVVGAIPPLFLILWLFGRLGEVWAAICDRRTLLTLAAAGFLLATNWFTFVWAVVTERLSEASLGYYINPLVSVLLGVIFLGERMRGFQLVAVVIAVAGVCVRAISIGELPWIPLVIAGAFGFYGLLRKQVNAGPAAGLMVESIILLPIMVGLLLFVEFDTGTTFLQGPAWVSVLLLLGGVQTIVPLLFFIGAAKRLNLATVGILQYIAPTGQLLLAVFFLGEPFGVGSAIAFVLIWIAVITYSIDSIRKARREAVPDEVC